jgi:hypothetical protein
MTDKAHIQASSDKNTHIREFLSRYVELPYSPYYAVLLTGPWGIGKTFLVKEFLRKQFGDDREHNDKKCIYVSLYGLTSIDEIDAALFQAAYPLLSNKPVQLAGRMGMAIMKSVAKIHSVSLPDLTISEFFKPQAALYVFDDLERCEMSINKSLGYINEFVEHEGRKVVIIANEQEIKDKEEYARRREKIIGKAFEVQSVLDGPLTSFIELLDDPPSPDLKTRRTCASSPMMPRRNSSTHTTKVTPWTTKTHWPIVVR